MMAEVGIERRGDFEIVLRQFRLQCKKELPECSRRNNTIHSRLKKGGKKVRGKRKFLKG